MPKSNPEKPKKSRPKKSVYLDYASGALSGSANPSALHNLGFQEKKRLEGARERVAKSLGARSREIIFTSGATESNNLAILGAPSGHVITTNIEHASVLETVAHRKKFTFVAVEPNGIVDPRKIAKAVLPDTVLISVMYANNEIGTIQPITELAKLVRRLNKTRSRKIYLHTDAVQAANYLPLDVSKLHIDLLSLNAAKIYGPKGIGVLYVKEGTPLEPIMFGGNQEGGLRPGTENVFGAEIIASKLLQAEKLKSRESKRLSTLRDYFLNSLIKLNKKIIINGDREHRLPNNVNITIPGIPSELLVIELSERGIMASSKSACKSGDGRASHVLQAINPEMSETDGSLRFSLGRDTAKKDIDIAVKALSEILLKLSKWYN